jgi:peptide/nickel transport system substrate-binding protein
VAALMAAGTIPGVSWSAEDNILKIRTITDIASLDIAFGTGQDELTIASCIFNKLTAFKLDKNWGWQLEAAKSMKQLDPLRVEFTLKPGIMYTNGYGEMTAEDVKYSFERIIDPKMKSPYSNDWEALEQVKIKDKYTGIIILKKPFAPLWNTTLPGPSGLIHCKKAMEKIGGKFTTNPPTCSGPYVLHEWKPKQVTILKRNKLWKHEEPMFDEIHFFPIESDSTAEAVFEVGDLDFTVISVAAYQNLRKNPPKGAKLLSAPSLFYSWLGINMENPTLKDIRVRKAIQMAVDVNAIIESVYFGLTKPATGFISPGTLGYRKKGLIPPEANIEGAKKLLVEAGYSDGLDVRLACLNKTEVLNQAQVIQTTLGLAGIRVAINAYDSGTFWSLGIDENMGEKAKDLQLFIQRFSSFPDPSFAFQWFVSDQVGVWNWERHSNAEFDKLFHDAVGERDVTKRNLMYQRMQEILELSGCYRFIAHDPNFILCRQSIEPRMRPDGSTMSRYFKRL